MDSTLWPLIVAIVTIVALDVTSLRWGHDSRSGFDRRQDWS